MSKFKTRFFYYVVGILILSLGIALTIKSQLGTSPFDALLVGLSTNVGFTVGSWEIIIAIILLLCNSLLIKKRPEYLGLVTAFITGAGIDLWLFVFAKLIIPKILVYQLIGFAIGMLFIGLGTAVYLHTSFAASPLDRLMLILRDLTKMNILMTKSLIYLFFLLMALIFDGPISIGTLLTVLLGGPILNYFMPLTEKIVGLPLNTTAPKQTEMNHSN